MCRSTLIKAVAKIRAGAESGGNSAVMLRNPTRFLLLAFVLFALPAKTQTTNFYCPTGEPPVKQVVFVEADTVWGFYPSGLLWFSVKYTPDTAGFIVMPVSRERIVCERYYYQNGQIALFNNKDSLISYTEKGKRRLYVNGDSIVVFRKSGTPMLACTGNRRVYTNKKGKIIFERLNDSLTAFDRAGKVTATGRISGDSIYMFKRDACVFYGTLQDYLLRSRVDLFYVTERREVKSETDILFLLAPMDNIVQQSRSRLYRKPEKETMPGSVNFFLFYE